MKSIKQRKQKVFLDVITKDVPPLLNITWFHISFSHFDSHVLNQLKKEKLNHIFQDKQFHPMAIRCKKQNIDGSAEYESFNFSSEQFATKKKLKAIQGNHYIPQYNNRFVPMKQSFQLNAIQHQNLQKYILTNSDHIMTFETVNSDHFVEITANQQRLIVNSGNSMDYLRQMEYHVCLPDSILKLGLAPFVPNANFSQIMTSFTLLEDIITYSSTVCKDITPKDKNELLKYKKNVSDAQAQFYKLNNSNVPLKNAPGDPDLSILIADAQSGLASSFQNVSDFYMSLNKNSRYEDNRNFYEQRKISAKEHAIFTKNPHYYGELAENQLVQPPSVFVNNFNKQSIIVKKCSDPGDDLD